MSGEFIVVNKHLLKDLIGLNIWNEGIKQKLMAANGSVQGIDEIPDEYKSLYKTAWEISQKAIIDMSADRGAYICQSQSLNLFVENPNFGKLSSMHFYAWQKGLKTGMYYLRSKAAVDPIKFTLDAQHQRVKAKAAAENENTLPANEDAMPEGKACSLDDPTCLACSA